MLTHFCNNFLYLILSIGYYTSSIPNKNLNTCKNVFLVEIQFFKDRIR